MKCVGPIFEQELRHAEVAPHQVETRVNARANANKLWTLAHEPLTLIGHGELLKATPVSGKI